MEDNIGNKYEEITEPYCSTCINKIGIDSDGYGKCQNNNCVLPHEVYIYKSLEKATKRGTELELTESLWLKPQIFQIKRTDKIEYGITYFKDQVKQYIPEKLTELIQEDALKAILSTNGDKLGCHFTILEGKELTRIEPQKMTIKFADKHGLDRSFVQEKRFYTKFCCTMDNENKNESNDSCDKFYRQIAKQIIEKNDVYPLGFPCKVGLWGYAHPMKIGNHIIAILFSGQKRIKITELENELQKKIKHLSDTLHIPKEEIEAALPEPIEKNEFNQFIRDTIETSELIQEVSNNYYQEISSRHDQYFLQEITSRIKNEQDYFLKNNGKAIRYLCEEHISKYIKIDQYSIFISENKKNNTYYRECNPTCNKKLISISNEYISRCVEDRIGLVPIFSIQKREELKRAIKSGTMKLQEPLFLIRIINKVKKEFLIVFHGNVDNIISNYIPSKQNPRVRLFYNFLTKTIESELNQIEDIKEKQFLIDAQRIALMSITHTVKRPLIEVVSGASFVRKFLSEDKQIKHWMHQIMLSGNDALALAGSMSKVFKCLLNQTDTIVYNRETVNVEEIVKSIAKRMRLFEVDSENTKTNKKKLNIHYLKKVDNINIQADRTTILFICYNLLDNAIKYSDSNTTIRIEYGREISDKGAELCLKVKSTGVPIPINYGEENKPFKLFWRGTEGQPGLGVGLWASRFLLEKQGVGGKIWLLPREWENDRLSIFCVKFPQLKQRNGKE